MAPKNNSKTYITATITCCLIVIVGLVVLFASFVLVGRYVANKYASSGGPSASTLPSDWSQYQNSQMAYAIGYPKSLIKTDDTNGMGTQFSPELKQFTIHSFAVYSNGSNATKYLDGVYSLTNSGLLGKQVTQISKSSHKLGSLDGEVRLWKNVNSSQAEVRLAAVGGDKMYNLSMTCDYKEYVARMDLFDQMAETFQMK